MNDREIREREARIFGHTHTGKHAGNQQTPPNYDFDLTPEEAKVWHAHGESVKRLCAALATGTDDALADEPCIHGFTHPHELSDKNGFVQCAGGRRAAARLRRVARPPVAADDALAAEFERCYDTPCDHLATRACLSCRQNRVEEWAERAAARLRERPAVDDDALREAIYTALFDTKKAQPTRMATLKEYTDAVLRALRERGVIATSEAGKP